MQNLVLLIIKPFSYSELVKNNICFYDTGFFHLLKIAMKNELSIFFKGKKNKIVAIYLWYVAVRPRFISTAI